jgi:hypothetical protein
MAREQDHRQRHRHLRQPGDQLKAGIAWHVDVRDQEIKFRRAQHFGGNSGIRCDLARKTLPAQKEPRSQAKSLIVISDKDPAPRWSLPVHSDKA